MQVSAPKEKFQAYERLFCYPFARFIESLLKAGATSFFAILFQSPPGRGRRDKSYKQVGSCQLTPRGTFPKIFVRYLQVAEEPLKKILLGARKVDRRVSSAGEVGAGMRQRETLPVIAFVEE